MILILTGPVQSGKTRFLGEVLAGLDGTRTGASGFLSPAVYDRGRLVGYDLDILGRGQPVPYIRKTGEPGWERVGPYVFVPEALSEARRSIRQSPPRDLLVVDEVGPLELGGGGLWAALAEVLPQPGRRFLLVVRAACLQTLPERLGSREFKVFPVEEPSARAGLLYEIRRGASELSLRAGRAG